MRVAIFEDELFAREQLKLSIKRLRPKWQLVMESDSLAEAVDYFNNVAEGMEPDLIFMDIELSDGSCFDIFERAAVPCPVVFTTAYSEFALRAFRTDSVDYLLKPVTEAELLRAINKFESRKGEAVPAQAAVADSPSRILCMSGDMYSAISTESIAWLQSEDKCVVVVTMDGKRRLAVTANLSAIENQFDERKFFRLSRSVVANVASIVRVSKYFKGKLLVSIRAGELSERVVVTAARRDAFLAWYGYS